MADTSLTADVVSFDEVAWLRDNSPAWRLLRADHAEVRSFSSLAHATAETCPRLVPWLTRRPVQLLRLADRWDKLLATVRWIDEQQSPGMYLRQVDVPGVDTKFVEHHRGVLGELLDLQFAPDRIDADATDFAGRYRFRRKPGYVRPAVARLDLLDAEEAELHRDLVDGTLGPSVRLEQERIRFAAIERAVAYQPTAALP